MSTEAQTDRAVSTPLLIVLGVVALAAVAYLLSTVVGGDDAAAPVSPDLAVGTEAATDGASAPAGAVDDATEAPSEIAAVEPTFEVFDARDPFEELVADNIDSGGTIDGTQQTSATTPVDGSDPTSSTTTTTPPAAPGAPTEVPAAGGAPAQTTVGATTILLDDVFSDGGVDKALVVVNDEGFEASEGDVVAGKVTVLDIAGNCATMRYEDKRFILCEGEQIQK